MAYYTPITGIITNIEYQVESPSRSSACTLFLTLESEEQGLVNVTLPSGTYVLNLHPLQIGDRATFFYVTDAPMPMVYSPRYRASAAAYTPHGVTAVLDVFDSDLTNSERTLTLTPTWNTPVMLPNGQTYAGDFGNTLILATYTGSTRSIPAQAIPEQMVVFCQ